MLLLGGTALSERGLRAASRISVATGARLLAETFPARLERGAGLPGVDRLAYLAEMAEAQLAGVDQLILAGARSPVSFFAYPDKPSDLVPPGCSVTVLAEPDQDTAAALEALANQVAAGTKPVLVEAAPPPPAEPGPLNAISLANTIAASLPEHAIVSDEANTSGFALPMALAAAPRHTLLTLTGGAIGQGMPVATGAAIAAPDRPVLSLEADGSALYTLQALWTQAREARRHDRADQQRRLRDPANGTGPHPGWPSGRRADGGEGRADAGPVPPHPGLHPAQQWPRRPRPSRHHG